MTTIATHWTERSIEDFLYKIAADFVDQLQPVMSSVPLNQAELAKRLGITRGRVSQIFNNPGNLTLKQIIRYARALGLKVAIVAYNDDDAENERGPINSDVFRLCWESSGSPDNFQQLNVATAVTTGIAHKDLPLDWSCAYNINGQHIVVRRSDPSHDATSGRTVKSIQGAQVLIDAASTQQGHAT